MIRIFNNKKAIEILIDENVNSIDFTPRHYDDKPYITIDFDGFSFSHHALNCSDCNKFIDSFGTESVDWYISYSNHFFRLDTKQIDQKGYPDK